VSDPAIERTPWPADYGALADKTLSQAITNGKPARCGGSAAGGGKRPRTVAVGGGSMGCVLRIVVYGCNPQACQASAHSEAVEPR
jgi:hypothetical protein